MKKFLRYFLTLSVLFGIGIGQSYAYDSDGYPNTKREIPGAPSNYAYREYQLVRYGATSQGITLNLSQGDVVVADCVSDDGVSVGLVGTVGSSDAVKGVVVSTLIQTADVAGTTAETDYGRRNWGYIQVKGLCTKVNITGGSAVAGSTIVASPVARYATAPVITNGLTRTLGFAYDASAQGQSEASLEV